MSCRDTERGGTLLRSYGGKERAAGKSPGRMDGNKRKEDLAVAFEVLVKSSRSRGKGGAKGGRVI